MGTPSGLSTVYGEPAARRLMMNSHQSVISKLAQLKVQKLVAVAPDSVGMNPTRKESGKASTDVGNGPF